MEPKKSTPFKRKKHRSQTTDFFGGSLSSLSIFEGFFPSKVFLVGSPASQRGQFAESRLPLRRICLSGKSTNGVIGGTGYNKVTNLTYTAYTYTLYYRYIIFVRETLGLPIIVGIASMTRIIRIDDLLQQTQTAMIRFVVKTRVFTVPKKQQH